MTVDIAMECEGCAKQKQSGADFLNEMIAAGLKAGTQWSSQPEVETETAQQETQLSDFLKQMLEAGEEAGDKPIKLEHNKPDTKKWTDKQKMDACPRNGGSGFGVKANIRKLWNGDTQILPRYCNMCEGCYKHNAKELKERMEYIDSKARYDTKENGGGHWRKAIVEDDKEAKALKKKANRNQDNRHVEFAAEQAGCNEVWTYVDDNEPEPEKYGEAADPESIDFDKVYKRNRETGKKFSVGKAFRSSSPATKQETIRIIIPEVVVKIEDSDKAEKIMRETNLINEATTPQEAQETYANEFKYLLIELEKEGIEVLAVDNSYYNINPDRLLEEWNRKCKYWMSINASLPKDSDAKADIKNRLYYPENR